MPCLALNNEAQGITLVPITYSCFKMLQHLFRQRVASFRDQQALLILTDIKTARC